MPCIEGVKGGAVDGGSRDDRTEVERKDKGKACEDDKIDGEKVSFFFACCRVSRWFWSYVSDI